MPVLTTKYQKQQTAVKLKKVYSELTQAMALSEVHNGNKETWNWSGIENTGYEFFKKYMQQFVVISESTKSDVTKSNNIVYKYLSGNTIEDSGVLTFRSKSKVINLASGSQLFLATGKTPSQEHLKKTTYFATGVDINGYKKPNRMGRDIFIFYITPDGIIPFQKNDGENYKVKRSREELINGESEYKYTCNKESGGEWCAALIMHDGWEIKDDYPW